MDLSELFYYNATIHQMYSVCIATLKYDLSKTFISQTKANN